MLRWLGIGNYYLLCDLTFKSTGRHLVIPVPLFVLDGLLEGWWLLKHFLKFLPREKLQMKWSMGSDFALEEHADEIVAALQKFWRKIRRCRRLEIVDVENKDIKVKIKLL